MNCFDEFIVNTYRRTAQCRGTACFKKGNVADRLYSGWYKRHFYNDIKSKYKSVYMDGPDVLRHQLHCLADGSVPRGSQLRLSVFEHRIYHRCICRLFLFRRINDSAKNRRHSHYLYRRIFVIPFLILSYQMCCKAPCFSTGDIRHLRQICASNWNRTI